MDSRQYPRYGYKISVENICWSCLLTLIAFGGDPNRIVLGGHSSGGVHVSIYIKSAKIPYILISFRSMIICGTIPTHGSLEPLK